MKVNKPKYILGDRVVCKDFRTYLLLDITHIKLEVYNENDWVWIYNGCYPEPYIISRFLDWDGELDYGNNL